jgi:uncharacterized protein DUF3617
MRQAILLFLPLILAAFFAQAQDVPKRKSGLWEVKRTTARTEGKQRIVQMCIDQASDNAFRHLAEGMRSESCKTEKVRRDGDRLLVDAVCDLGRAQVTAKTQAVITGRFDSAYKIESKSTYDPPMRGKAEGSAVLEARWLGACKPDQRPGDYILANGVKLRVTDTEEEKAVAKAAAEKAAAAEQAAKDAKAAKLAKPKGKGDLMPVPKLQ